MQPRIPAAFKIQLLQSPTMPTFLPILLLLLLVHLQGEMKPQILRFESRKQNTTPCSLPFAQDLRRKEEAWIMTWMLIRIRLQITRRPSPVTIAALKVTQSAHSRSVSWFSPTLLSFRLSPHLSPRPLQPMLSPCTLNCLTSHLYIAFPFPILTHRISHHNTHTNISCFPSPLFCSVL